MQGWGLKDLVSPIHWTYCIRRFVPIGRESTGPYMPIGEKAQRVQQKQKINC